MPQPAALGHRLQLMVPRTLSGETRHRICIIGKPAVLLHAQPRKPKSHKIFCGVISKDVECQIDATVREVLGNAREGGLNRELHHEDSRFDTLKDHLANLQNIVKEQQAIIQQQQDAIDGIKGYITKQRQSSLSSVKPPHLWRGEPREVRPFDAQRVSIGDRRYLGLYDARFHSTSWGATPPDYRVLPERIILVRHAESEGNVDNVAYTYIPDPQVPLTWRGAEQAKLAGQQIKHVMDQTGSDYRLFFYTSPYKRSLQTFEGISAAFRSDQVVGVQEEVQLREQDFGNFQDGEGKKKEKAERLRFGRFFYRFPNGESGADVYDRITIFEDHMIRDINAGRFGRNTSLVLVTHGLALRVFLMRWFHWTVDQFLSVYNAPNAEPLVLERVANDLEARTGGPISWIHTKSLYRLTDASMNILKGCTSDMCSTTCMPPGLGKSMYRQVSSTKGAMNSFDAQ